MTNEKLVDLMDRYGIMVRPSLGGNWRAGKWLGVTGDGKAYCIVGSEVEAPTIYEAVLGVVDKMKSAPIIPE